MMSIVGSKSGSSNSFPHSEGSFWQISLHQRSVLQNVVIAAGASGLIALFAPVSIPLPFSPVPLATQLHVILFLSVLLGSQRAVFAVIGFLIQAAWGLPVLAGAKVLITAGPTFGYLIGYVFAAFTTGLMVERFRVKTSLNLFASMAIGNLIAYLCGALWLSTFVGLKSAILYGVLPFLAGDFLKIIISLKALKALRFYITPST
ncbi:MAG: biotin transporter BioY [Anaerolineae bacterium]